MPNVLTGVLVVSPSPVFLLRIFRSQPSAFASLGEAEAGVGEERGSGVS
jgi:hypothetical protein